MMMMIMIYIYIILLLNIINIIVSAADFYHQSPDQFKLSPGWQEPGLWRPKWIMDRVFDATDEEPEKNDRIYFKLKSDRTMKIYKNEKRPILELFRPKKESEKKKKLFESGNEEMSSFQDQFSKSKDVKDSFFEVDGTWWWQDAAPLPQGKVKLETREYDKKTNKKEMIRHDIRCDWGVLDGYAARFRRGKMYKYKMTEAGIPVGTSSVGSFTIKVSPHRPLISKDYLAFQ